MSSIQKSELARKTIHISNAIIPLSYLYLFKEKIDMIIILAFFVIFCFIIEIFRERQNVVSKFFSKWLDFMMRDNEKKGRLTGATWVFVGALFTVLIVPSPYCILALLFLAVGDTFAAIIGMRFPLIRIGKKTLSGSVAGLIACIIVGFIIDLTINPGLVFFGAIMAMVIEIIPLPIDDNLSIPLFSGSSMYFASLAI